MIDRDFLKGPIILRCDGCASGFVETGTTAFHEAMTIAKGDGWTIRHCGPGQGWCHFCADCTEAKVWDAPAKQGRAA